ncbi:uncharacterized protein LOC122533379 isoform X2 [Frieseomelitta varia]|uniref:uncharacterized protein LOC122533379 isoform X2 n=1 Tax=Frieseomelitta varia TaxID=561572 RepID=UPI001CB69C02|nr:uncharacterized protein LOC122533379 isoform X2 [Frieseomelitta varia]
MKRDSLLTSAVPTTLLLAVKDDSRHEAVVSSKEIKKLKIANRAETRRPRRNLAIAACQGLHLGSYSNPNLR